MSKAERAGVEIICADYDQLAVFHELVAATGRRSGFPYRSLSYLQRQYRELTSEDPDRMKLYLASHQGKIVAGATLLRAGERAWFQTGGSSVEGRESRPSNALQWQLISDAHAGGAAVYDMRGISDTVDPGNDMYGLTRFKLGTRGSAVETLGEWDLSLRPLLHKAVGIYLQRRSTALSPASA